MPEYRGPAFVDLQVNGFAGVDYNADGPVEEIVRSFQAMERSRHRWDLVTEDLQEACMQRLSARLRFNEELPVINFRSFFELMEISNDMSPAPVGASGD